MVLLSKVQVVALHGSDDRQSVSEVLRRVESVVTGMSDWKQHIDPKSFIPEMQRAMEDLKRAAMFSGVDNEGTITAYEIDGTAKTIQIAVWSLVACRLGGGPHA